MALINDTSGLDQLNLIYIVAAGAIIGIGLGVFYIKRQNRKNREAMEQAEIDQMIKGGSKKANSPASIIEDTVILENDSDIDLTDKTFTVIKKTESSEPIKIDATQTKGDLKEILKNLAEQKGFSLTDFTTTTTKMTGDDIDKLKEELKKAMIKAKENNKD